MSAHRHAADVGLPTAYLRCFDENMHGIIIAWIRYLIMT